MRYGVALLQTIDPETEQAQRQLKHAFLSAKQAGATENVIQASLSMAARLNLCESLTVVGLLEAANQVNSSIPAIGLLKNLQFLASCGQLRDSIKVLERAEFALKDELLLRQARSCIQSNLLASFLPATERVNVRTYAGLNKLLTIGFVPPSNAIDLLEASAELNLATPLVLIQNSRQVDQSLQITPYWIAYGNVRSGSTVVFNLLRILANSSADSVLSAWEGDFQNPSKFFEILSESPGIDIGVLKIHRSDAAVNSFLASGAARAVITFRDMRTACYSYWRMLHNRHSPFFMKDPSLDKLDEFIKNEIREFREKSSQPNTLLIGESTLRSCPREAISKITGFLGIDLEAESDNFLSDYLGVERMKGLAEDGRSTRNSAGHKQKTYLHVNHVTNDSSANACDERAKEYIESILSTKFKMELDRDCCILANH